MATQDKDKQVWLSFTDPVKLARKYHIPAEQMPLLKQMSTAMKKMCEQAISPNAVPAS